MKKLMTLAVISALSLTTVAEAKRGGGFKMTRSKPSTYTSQQHKSDATFNNTPHTNAIPKQATPQPSVSNGNRMGNFVTGAAAGYLLSNMLSPSEAQAQPQSQQPTTAAENTSASAVSAPAVQRFKLFDPTDPNLIERNANYARYCLGGIQYIVSGSKAIPLVDNSNQPQSCIIEQ